MHDIDLICNVLGEYPCEVFAVASSFIREIGDINDHDTVAITLKFSSGAIGIIDLSRYAVYGYDQRLEVMYIVQYQINILFCQFLFIKKWIS